MRKTMKKTVVLASLLFCLLGMSSCMKKTLIDTYEKTYSTYTSGNENFYKPGGTFSQMVGQGKVKLYIDPKVYVISGVEDAYVSMYSADITSDIHEAMLGYGYVIVDKEEDADFMIQATNFQLWYSGTIWVPGSAYIDPYFAFWGGYYPWVPVYYISVGTNKLLMEIVEANSLRKYRDWYRNTWLPSNPDKRPGVGNVPEECKPIVPWKAEITGELEDKQVNDAARMMSHVTSAFVQSPYLDVNEY